MTTLLTIAVLFSQQAQDPPEPIQYSADVRQALAAQIEKNRLPRKLNYTEESVYSKVEVPDDPKQQGVFVLHDASGFTRVYRPLGQLMLSRLQVANLTREKVELSKSSIRLRIGRDEFAHQPWFGPGSRLVLLKNRATRPQLHRAGKEPEGQVVSLEPGEVKQILAVFQNLPQGGVFQPIVLTVTGLPQPVRIDVLQEAREAMQLSVTRTGPRDCLAVVTLGGSLHQVGAHALTNELQTIADAGASRLVVLWGDGDGESSSQSGRVGRNVKTWLREGAKQNRAYSHLPPLPAGLQEVHLGPFPGSSSISSSSSNAHDTNLKATSAALVDVYQQLPTKDVLEAIAGDDLTIRVAAIRGAIGRLPASALPTLLKLADGDPDVQEAAVEALSQFPDEAAIDRVAEFVTGKDDDLARIATRGLMSSRFPAAQQKLVRLVESLEGDQRKRLVTRLLDSPNAIWSDLYFEYASAYQENGPLALKAFNALDKIGHPKLRQLRAEALESGNKSIASDAFRAMSTSGHPEDLQLVLDYTLRQIATQRPTSPMLNVLQRAGSSDATQHLMRYYRAEKTTSTKNSLLMAIIRTGDQSVIPFLIETYKTSPNSPLAEQQRATILDALHARRVPEVYDLAVDAMSSSNPTVVATACRILEEAATPEAVAAIVDSLIKSRSTQDRRLQTVRTQCLRSLGAIATPKARRYLRIVQNSGEKRDQAEATNQLRYLLIRSPAIDYLARASELREEKKLKEAEETYALALRADPGLPEIYIQRGHMKTHNGRRSEGVQDFELALDIDPLHPIATSLRAIAIVVLGNPDGGLKAIEDNAETFKRDEVFNYNAACAYGQALKTNKPTPENVVLRKKWRDRGLYFLEHCVNELGYGGEKQSEDAELFKTDPDLDPFRKEERFKKLWEKIEPNLPTPEPEEQPEPKPVERQKQLDQ